jgi:hypothetical protein
MPRCKTCDAGVEYVPTAKNGVLIPLDAEPAADGNIVLRNGVAHVLSKEALDALPRDTPRWRTHFSTCRDAAKHRKSK